MICPLETLGFQGKKPNDLKWINWVEFLVGKTY